MPAELLIRPGRQDHIVVADLIAPGGAGRSFSARPPISRLVLDAPLAVSRPQFGEDARAAGLPLTIDPMTFLLQGETDPEHAWTRLSFATAGAVTPAQLAEPGLRRSLVSRTVDFQIEHGATVIVPPYFHAGSPTDPWFDASLACLSDTASYLRHLGARLPLSPVLTGRLDRFARPAHWAAGIDRFADSAMAAGARTVATQLGPAGKPKDNYAKVLHLFHAAQRLRRPGLPMHAWRQGAYGPALVAAGLQGYETGISAGESTERTGRVARGTPRRLRRPAPRPPGPVPAGAPDGGIELRLPGRPRRRRCAARQPGHASTDRLRRRHRLLPQRHGQHPRRGSTSTRRPQPGAVPRGDRPDAGTARVAPTQDRARRPGWRTHNRRDEHRPGRRRPAPPHSHQPGIAGRHRPAPAWRQQRCRLTDSRHRSVTDFHRAVRPVPQRFVCGTRRRG